MSDPVRAVYTIRCAPEQAPERARLLALEQTVELPAEAVRDDRIRAQVAGKVERCHALSESEAQVEIAYPAGAFDGGPAQFLNVLFGNSSLLDDVLLTDVDPPRGFMQAMGGPRFGIEGLREMTGVEGRPLTCAALKPVGLGCDALAGLCRTFAKAGIDVIKDDHGFADQETAPFEERVRACCDATAEAGKTLYVPNLIGDPYDILLQLETVKSAGVEAVMVEPMLTGLPFFSTLVRNHLAMPVIAHPALAGAPRIAPAALLGKIFRMLGADAVIYPHSGGRFSYDEETCRDLARRMREPWGSLKPCLPVPAGGMSVEQIGELVRFYGGDVMFLVGGSLYLAGDALPERAAEFVQAVRGAR